MLFSVLGCQTRPPGTLLAEGTGELLDSMAKVGGGCPTAKMAKLTLAGEAIPVEIGCSNANGTIDIRLSAFDAVFEKEKYRQTDATFELLDAAGESYDPPVVLARVPMHIGDKWAWKGKMMAGPIAHNAKATVGSSQEHLFPPSGSVDALRVQVDFEIDGGGPTPAKRSLVFWMAPGLGVLKRQFGSSSIREPAGP